jgi:hypothetical protein
LDALSPLAASYGLSSTLQSLEIEMTKPQKGGASVREQKAAALDALVKGELAKKRVADAAKTARLKALRLARDAELSKAPPVVTKRRFASE